LELPHAQDDANSGNMSSALGLYLAADPVSALSGSSSVPKRSDRGELKPQEQDSVSFSRGLHDDGERGRFLRHGQM
jgi:hypothetical protein